MWRMGHSKEWWRQGVRSWCITVSVCAADSDSLCALSLSLLFAHSLPHFSPAPFRSQSSQQTDVLLLDIELYSTVGVSNSGAPLALMCECVFLTAHFCHHTSSTLIPLWMMWFSLTHTLSKKQWWPTHTNTLLVKGQNGWLHDPRLFVCLQVHDNEWNLKMYFLSLEMST